MKNYASFIREYSKNNYKNITRDSCEYLKYPFIVPGKAYAHQLWDWDSWLTNIAIRQIITDNNGDCASFSEYEKGCILNFLDYADEDGKIPISITAEKNDGLLQQYENIHKPCLAQHIAFIMQQTDNDCSWFMDKFEKLELFINNYKKNQKHTDTGLYFWIDDCAIGVDNDPCTFFRPKNSSASIFLNCLMYKELKAMEYICKCAKKPASSYAEEAESLKKAIHEHLWDERNGFYYSADLNLLPIEKDKILHSGMPRHWSSLIQRIDVWSGFMAMWAGIATKEQAERMVEENYKNERTFASAYGVRSLSKSEKMYCVVKSGNPSCWLGPIWGISNYMCFQGLVNYGFLDEATELAKKTVKLFGQDIEKNGEMHEYYDPDTGIGVNNPGFQSWNLLANNMLAWLEKKPVISEF